MQLLNTHPSSAETPSPVLKRKVLVVDDHPVLREGLSKRINSEKDLVCTEVQCASEALQALEQEPPDIMVIDLGLGRSHGLELIKEIRSHDQTTPIVVFTMYEEGTYAVRALKAGAQGYVTKHESAEYLLESIRTVLRGGYAFSPQVSKMLFESSKRPGGVDTLADSLGDRELEIFELMGGGMGTSRIAAQLGRSVKTIETYQARIKRKLNLKSATELRREAVRWAEKPRSGIP